jgi:hypothetical protein
MRLARSRGNGYDIHKGALPNVYSVDLIHIAPGKRHKFDIVELGR